ncbi:helix-turn-helix domain-containing protein [Paenibacillus sp. GCM10023252]|uniref:AraC family transcriptional regulator n=1 Tax=Paenibacillus sp. GCM10023252 TaxID=3252649 RepID=UPI003618773F
MLRIISAYHDVGPNWHERNGLSSHLYVLLLITHGQCLFVVKGQSIRLKKGDLLFLPKATPWEGHSLPDESHQKYSVVFDMSADAAEQFPLLASSSHIRLHTRSYEYLHHRFGYLVQNWFGRLPNYVELTCAVVWELLALVHRELHTEGQSTKRLKTVQRVQEYIQEHYRSSLTIRELAQVAERSPSHLVRMFREVTGLTPMDYLHGIRIAHGRELLLNTSSSMASIAEYLGYCDASYFNRVFKRMIGMPPSSLRN